MSVVIDQAVTLDCVNSMLQFVGLGQEIRSLHHCLLLITLRAKLSGAVYYYRSCLQRAGERTLCACGFVGLLPR